MSTLEQTTNENPTSESNETGGEASPHRRRRRGLFWLIGSSAVASLIFAGAAGTTSVLTVTEWNNAQSAHSNAVKAALALRASDMKAHSTYDATMKKAQTIELLLVKLEAIAGPADWVSDNTYNDLDNARTSLLDTSAFTPGLKVPDPAPKKTDGMFITDLARETHRLQTFVQLHQADRDDTINTTTTLNGWIDSATTAITELAQEAEIAGQSVPTT